MELVHRLVWEVDGKRFVSPIAWEVDKDARSAARQAEYAMREAGITQDMLRFIGIEVGTQKPSDA